MCWALLIRAFAGYQMATLMIMVRVAEALSNAVYNNEVHCIRWDEEKNFLLMPGLWNRLI